MNEPGIQISNHPSKYDGNRMIYELETTHGMLDAIYDPTTGWFGIANINVDPDHTQRGIGKALLREALEVAKEQDARFIYAAIISRECLDAMRAVFGEDSIRVDQEGSYEERGKVITSMTRASLWFEVGR